MSLAVRSWIRCTLLAAASVLAEPSADAQVADESPPPATMAAATTRYFEIPIFGELGTDVTPEALQAALSEAEQADAKYVVLLFDSPGGDGGRVSAMIRILGMHHVPTVAFVRRATGSAALLASSCSKLYTYKAGVCATMGDIRRELGVTDWVSCGDRGAQIIASLREQRPSASNELLRSTRPQDDASAAPQVKDGAEEPNLYALLTNVASQINAKLPAQIDAETRWDRIDTGPHRSLIFTFTLVNVDASKLQISRTDLEQMARARVIANLKKLPQAQAFRRANLTLQCRFYDPRGNSLAEITLGPKEY